MTEEQLTSAPTPGRERPQRPDDEEQDKIVAEEMEWVSTHYAQALGELRNY